MSLYSYKPARRQRGGAANRSIKTAPKKPKFWQAHVISAILASLVSILAHPGFRKMAIGIIAETIIMTNLPINLQEQRV